MTHEEELIELLDRETATATKECNDTLSKQLNAIEVAFRKHDLKGKIVRTFISP